MTEQDFGDRLREVFSDGVVMDLEPLLRSLEIEGKIHPISCEEAIRSSLLDLKNHGVKETFYDSWNVVTHISDCSGRACSSLRTPMNISHIVYPTNEQYVQIENEVKILFIREKINEGLDSDRAHEIFENLLPKT